MSAKRITFVQIKFSDGDFIGYPIRHPSDWITAIITLWRYRKGTYR